MDAIVSQEERTLSVHQEHEFLARLERAGLTKELAQTIVGSKDNKVAQRVLKHLELCWHHYVLDPRLQSAAEIMGSNFIGPEVALDLFELPVPNSRVGSLHSCPYSEDTLRECVNDFVLIAVPPVSVRQICLSRQGVSSAYHLPKKLLNKYGWVDEPYDKSYQSVWHLISKKPIHVKGPSGIEKLQSSLSDKEELSHVAIALYYALACATVYPLRMNDEVICAPMSGRSFPAIGFSAAQQLYFNEYEPSTNLGPSNRDWFIHTIRMHEFIS